MVGAMWQTVGLGRIKSKIVETFMNAFRMKFTRKEGYCGKDDFGLH